ncbi:esterase/lipase family protein [Microbacterium sp. gxy059]|uniref:esterase/lipase family protein n=1 Tax=Microbacterium sp. gxy059 TaxID=2957199 RepID=UPI003D9610B3
MPKPSGRVRIGLERAAARAVDYGWSLREIGAGILRPRMPPEFAAGERAPVLLLPGVLENWTMMRRIARSLHAAGHPVHALPELRRNTVSVAEAADLGSAFLAAGALEGVVLVAHSKGGLIGKLMMLEDDGRRIDRMVAIATPFAGSTLARLVPHRTIRALRPDDATILDLAARRDVDARITSIFPRFDPHIPGGSRLEGATNVEIDAAGHFRVLGDDAVLAAVHAAAD